jgi:hypothetical protein
VNGADFLLQNEGTIAVLFPLTAAAVAWIDEYLPADTTFWTGGVVIEHRFVVPIIGGIVDAGLEVRA